MSETTRTMAQVSDPWRTDYSSTPFQESHISQGISSLQQQIQFKKHTKLHVLYHTRESSITPLIQWML